MISNDVVTLNHYIERHKLWSLILKEHPERADVLNKAIEDADKAIIAIVTSDKYSRSPNLNLTLEDANESNESKEDDTILRNWKARVELNWDEARDEEYKVRANTESNARKHVKEKVLKKYPNIGTRYHIVGIEIEE